MRGSKRHFAVMGALAWLFTTGGPPDVHAAEVDRQRTFREQYALAESAYNDRDYATAVERLRAVFAIEPVPLILFNLGQAYRKLGAYSDARVYYELYRSTARNLPPEEAAVVERHIVEMREREQAAQTPKVVEKTKLFYLQSEKPPPRWMFPVGLSAGLLGLGGVAGGATLLALHGRCSTPAEAPALECSQLYNTRLPGAMFAVAGGSLVVMGVVLITLSARRPTKPVLTETKVLPSEDALLPLLQSYGSGGRGERSTDGASKKTPSP